MSFTHLCFSAMQKYFSSKRRNLERNWGSARNIADEHRIIEKGWSEFGPKGAAVAAIAIGAIGGATGWSNAGWTVLFAISGLIVWLLIMKILILDRPENYETKSPKDG